MIEFELDLDVLGNTVFAFSPLAETASSLRLLDAADPAWMHRPWLFEARGRLQQAHPGVNIDLLRSVRPGESKWTPSFLYPPVGSPRTTIEDQLHALAALSADDLAADLVNVWPGSTWPRPLKTLLEHGPNAGKELAGELHRYWSTVIAPYWLRILGTLEEDVAYRATQSLQRGLFDLLAELHPRITLTGRRLRLDMSGHANASYGQARLTLVPSVFIFPGLVLTHDTPGHFEVTYGCRGAGRVWEGLAQASERGHSLRSLLGRSRAEILTLLHVPRSTTDLARELRQSPAAISQHLTVLRDAGLATSWRTGRIVLYQQTPLAASLVELNQIDQTRI